MTFIPFVVSSEKHIQGKGDGSQAKEDMTCLHGLRVRFRSMHSSHLDIGHVLTLPRIELKEIADISAFCVFSNIESMQTCVHKYA